MGVKRGFSEVPPVAGHAQMNYSGAVLYPLTTPNNATGGGGGRSFVAGQTVGYYEPYGYPVALLWSGPTGTLTNLNPNGFSESQAFGTNGSQQVGSGYGSPTVLSPHALLWSGTAASVIDLHPTNLGSEFNVSAAYGISGNQEVGYAEQTETQVAHAVLWSGTAASAIDLNPTGVSWSEALGTDGTQQVGYAYNSQLLMEAYMWSGTAASAVDLGPAGFYESRAVGVSGGQEVGYGFGPSTNLNGVGYDHAFLWTGSEASAVDLNPAGYMNSEALATNGSVQVGNAYLSLNAPSDSYDNAFAWSGSAASAVNLQSLLPVSGNWISSTAYSVDANGNIYGWAAGTLNGVASTYAVEWSPVPEPGTFALATAAAAGLLLRRKRRAIGCRA
jgi:hypothetical protein